MSLRGLSIGRGGGRSGSSGGCGGSSGGADSDEERKRRIRSDGARKRGAKRYENWGIRAPPAFSRREALDALHAGEGSSRGGARRAPSPASSDSGYVDYVSASEYEPSTDESDGDKVVPVDFVLTEEAEEAAIETLNRRSEHAAAAANKCEREDEGRAIIQVAAIEMEKEERKTRRIKREVVERDAVELEAVKRDVVEPEVMDLISDDE